MISVRRFAVFSIAALTCTIIGCAEQGPVCFPVRGQISFKGEPVAEAMVVLHRVGGDVRGHQKPIAYTGPDGRFTVTTFRQGDGAPPGEYVITVELRGLQTIGEEATRSGPNLLPAEYQRPEASDLKVRVGEGENEIPPIQRKG